MSKSARGGRSAADAAPLGNGWQVHGTVLSALPSFALSPLVTNLLRSNLLPLLLSLSILLPLHQGAVGP